MIIFSQDSDSLNSVGSRVGQIGMKKLVIKMYKMRDILSPKWVCFCYNSY